MFKNFNPTVLGIAGQQSEVIELALTYRFEGIDLNMAEFAARVRLKGLPYAKRLLQSSKLRIGTFWLPFACADDAEQFQNELKKLPEYASYAAELGCTCATTVLSPAGDKLPYHENFELHRVRLQQICEAMKPSGVRLAVGFKAAEYLRRNHAFQFIHDLDALMLLLDMVAAPNLGLLLDLWDAVECGAADSIRKLPADKIAAVQVAELPAGVMPADLDETSRLLPDAENGRVNVAYFLAALQAMGYQGPVTVRPSKSVFQSKRRETIAKQTADALAKVWPK